MAIYARMCDSAYSGHDFVNMLQNCYLLLLFVS